MRYCSSLTFSIQSTFLPFSTFVIAMWLIAVVAVAPCQCLTPGGFVCLAERAPAPARHDRAAGEY